MQNKLKPCPFCNSEIFPMFFDNYGVAYRYESGDESINYFKCFDCDTEFFHSELNNDPHKQINWWNNRCSKTTEVKE